MATHVLSEVLKHSRARLGDRLVIIVIADETGKETREASVSVNYIAQQTLLSPRAVQRSLNNLIDAGEITVLRAVGRENFSTYRVNALPLNGDNLSPFSGSGNGDIYDSEKVTSTTKKGDKSCTEMVTNPSASTSVNYSVISQQQQTLLARNDDDAVEGLDPLAWKKWVDYRKKIRKPLKPVSIPAAQRKLAAFGNRQLAVVEHCIANGYQGLFPPAGGKDGAARRRTFDEIHQEQSERIENLEASYGTAGAIPGTANRLD